ncbi:hypothetical protein C5B42_01250 [Candidatus Cerribacteria bacterium 'Amazon FNV 2010 28 9']|uniref:UDP-N-acetylglucosamine--N-acetylmuramyl-(pentapeptide) pyrophosphoryl-undecaprenol N-acetylglucosamine transferase n=1 Tax=Candidatus Cerribacteria bacterium 'Amazon FNV 2010 28 9' TaxID=2081795 RepID=A0A317JPM8_9BACT|nr:MAG: hypothetical protein C5B42_01250 [Candidatus Cerribacteria bacterium 'Amazon FNV 2010 28 9']
MKKNIYITGGHLTPSLAVIDDLLKNHSKEVKLFFIGREFAQTSPPQPSHEAREMNERSIPFFPIQAAKFHRQHFWRNFIEILKLPNSCWQVYTVFKRARPDVILSFGGYVAFPVCIVGKLFKARIITHEQTKVAGLANQAIAYLADTIAVANEESLPFFPKEKTVVTGNPIRESLLREYKTPPSWFPKELMSKPFIYVTGGSQGSQVINQTIATLLPKLVRSFVVIHQCGASQGNVYLHELEQQRLLLPEELQHLYIVREWIEAKDVSFLIRNAKFVISRAGANTVQEITLAGTPAIFIPLSFAYNNEQQKNCDPLVQQGAAMCILQKDLVPDVLYEATQSVMRNYEKMKKNADHMKQEIPKSGTHNVIKLILSSM